MNGVLVALCAAAGAAAGAASGWLAVQNERAEMLEEEEREERTAFEEEQRRLRTEAEERGDPPPAEPVWRAEMYGWTWQERIASPVLGAAAFAAFAAHDGADRVLPIHLLFVAVLLHIALFDLKHRLILDRVSLPAIPVALLLAHFTPGLTVVNAAVGAVLVFVFFAAQSLVLGGGVLGMGDAKLGALLGALSGIGFDADHLGAVYAVIAAILAGGVVAVFLLVTRLRGLRDPIPYGPFLCAGAALIMYHGPAGP